MIAPTIRVYGTALGLVVLLSLAPVEAVRAVSGLELAQAHRLLTDMNLDESQGQPTTGFVVAHKDFELRLGEGTLNMLDPISLNGDKLYCRAFYRGLGRMLFSPTPSMERRQLARFFERDSINCEVQNVVLYFDPAAFPQIVGSTADTTIKMRRHSDKRFRKLHRAVVENTAKDHMSSLLKGLAEPSEEPVLMVCTQRRDNGKDKETVLYKYDPNQRESVQFFKLYDEIAQALLERICRYSPLAGSNNEMINGAAHRQIDVKHYTTSASIGNNAEYQAKIGMTFEALESGVQVLPLDLGYSISVDSVLDVQGSKIEFARIDLGDKEFGALHLFFDAPLVPGENYQVTFCCGGKIAYLYGFEFLAPVSSDWYPSYGWSDQATFDMSFRLPDRLNLVAIGNETEREVRDDSLYTRFVRTRPATHATFTVGTLSRYDFQEADLAPVRVYFSEDLHRQASSSLARGLVSIGKDMEKQVASDVMGAMQLFAHYFGPFEEPHLTVTEILSSGGVAYPGFLQMGVSTWINTDKWGDDRLFRAHETAHQWWGIRVMPETYHDAWLSEAFAEYSALLYLQAVEGNKMFLDRLDKYRDRIFGVRRPLFGSRDETGSIALGYRNSTSQTAGDYSLIIYKKGAYVIHMLRNLLIDLETMNEERFFSLLRGWYEAQKDSLVTTDDFQRHCERHVGVEMDWFFDQWVNETELPVYKFSYEREKDTTGNWLVHCRVIQEGVPDDFQMYVPVDVEFDGDRHYYARVLINEPTVEFDLGLFDMKPKKLRLNPFQSVLCKVND